MMELATARCSRVFGGTQMDGDRWYADMKWTADEQCTGRGGGRRRKFDQHCCCLIIACEGWHREQLLGLSHSRRCNEAFSPPARLRPSPRWKMACWHPCGSSFVCGSSSDVMGDHGWQRSGLWFSLATPFGGVVHRLAVSGSAVCELSPSSLFPPGVGLTGSSGVCPSQFRPFFRNGHQIVWEVGSLHFFLVLLVEPPLGG
ncbi:queuine tRNA-ribosyltransferase [Striga asiatica]|uniref:Queuine tRNA-ribosyltransferase n=1 Tax=Striga asiatica TaxID=4170 RepID=A0A5A7QG89_STRAF|nr:queuine tRNA-ribosyltransferase [Striga asiatica]